LHKVQYASLRLYTRYCVSDEEILDVFSESVESSTVLRQDVIFARFSFSLHNGTLSLLHSSQHRSLPFENGIFFIRTSVLRRYSL